MVVWFCVWILLWASDDSMHYCNETSIEHAITPQSAYVCTFPQAFDHVMAYLHPYTRRKVPNKKAQ